MDPLTLFGLFAVTAMLVCYALEDRSRWFVLGFAVACASGIDLRISPGRLALWTGGGYLVFCRVATVVAANGLGSSTRGEVNNLFKMTHDRRATV